MSVAKLDENSRPTLTALASDGSGAIVTLYANKITHRLLVDIASGISSINGDTSTLQTLTVGTTGTDFAIVDNGSGDHKFNLPDASATARGVITTGAQTIAGVKTFSSTISGSINGNASTVTTNANLTGPITSVGNATTVNHTAFATLNGPQGFANNYIITRTVDGSSNITVALKTLAGTDPSATDPIYVRIGDSVRTIAAAISVTSSTAQNWLNAASTELTGQEIDYFVYAVYHGTAVQLAFARFSGARLVSDFNATNTNEKGYLTPGSLTATDQVEVIGRFNATYSNSGWAIPATSVIESKPIYDTRWLTWTPAITWVADVAPSGSPTHFYQYKLTNNNCYFMVDQDSYTAGTNVTVAKYTLPFSESGTASRNILITGYLGAAYAPNTSVAYINFYAVNIASVSATASAATSVSLSGLYSI